MLELASIAIRDRSYQPTPIIAGAKLDFRDTREFFPDDVDVLRRGRTELVKVDLLVEIGVFGWMLLALWIARVIEAGTVRFPIDAAAGGRKIDARDNVGKLPAAGDFENHAAAVFGAIFGDSDRDVFAIQGRNVKIDGKRSLTACTVRIEDDLCLVGIIGRGQGDKHWLFLRRVVFYGEEHSPAELEIIESRGAGPAQLREALFDGVAQREVVQIFAAASILSSAPLLSL